MKRTAFCLISCVFLSTNAQAIDPFSSLPDSEKNSSAAPSESLSLSSAPSSTPSANASPQAPFGLDARAPQMFACARTNPHHIVTFNLSSDMFDPDPETKTCYVTAESRNLKISNTQTQHCWSIPRDLEKASLRDFCNHFQNYKDFTLFLERLRTPFPETTDHPVFFTFDENTHPYLIPNSRPISAELHPEHYDLTKVDLSKLMAQSQKSQGVTISFSKTNKNAFDFSTINQTVTAQAIESAQGEFFKLNVAWSETRDKDPFFEIDHFYVKNPNNQENTISSQDLENGFLSSIIRLKTHEIFLKEVECFKEELRQQQKSAPPSPSFSLSSAPSSTPSSSKTSSNAPVSNASPSSTDSTSIIRLKTLLKEVELFKEELQQQREIFLKEVELFKEELRQQQKSAPPSPASIIRLKTLLKEVESLSLSSAPSPASIIRLKTLLKEVELFKEELQQQQKSAPPSPSFSLSGAPSSTPSSSTPSSNAPVSPGDFCTKFAAFALDEDNKLHYTHLQVPHSAPGTFHLCWSTIDLADTDSQIKDEKVDLVIEQGLVEFPEAQQLYSAYNILQHFKNTGRECSGLFFDGVFEPIPPQLNVPVTLQLMTFSQEGAQKNPYNIPNCEPLKSIFHSKTFKEFEFPGMPSIRQNLNFEKITLEETDFYRFQITWQHPQSSNGYFLRIDNIYVRDTESIPCDKEMPSWTQSVISDPEVFLGEVMRFKAYEIFKMHTQRENFVLAVKP